MNDRADPTQDPDLAHLLDLLDMLPGPVENREFWAAVQAKGRPVEPREENLRYVYEKMTAIWFVRTDPTPQRIAHLSEYLLFFFSGDRPMLWELLNPVTRLDFGLHPLLNEENDDSGANYDSPGRWWTEDVCRTAWVLYVRYSARHDWEKWRLRSSWLEWLPSSDAGQ